MTIPHLLVPVCLSLELRSIFREAFLRPHRKGETDRQAAEGEG